MDISYPISKHLNSTDVDVTTPVYTPIFLSEEHVSNYLKTGQALYYNMFHSNEFSWIILGYSAVILFAIVYNFMKNFTPGFVLKC